MKIPEPMIPPMTIMVASSRPSRRASRWINLSILAWLYGGVGALGMEFVFLNFQRDRAVLGSDHCPARDKLERRLAVQLSRPTDGHFHLAPRHQHQVRGEQESRAAHIDSLTGAQFIGVLPFA